MSSRGNTERVMQIELTIKHLNSLRTQLKQDASDVKAKMYAKVNHIVGTLSQVDETLQMKEEALQVQIGKLNRVLGILQSDSPGNLDGAVDKELTETLEMLKNMKLTSEELPKVFCQMNDVKLVESDNNYGMPNDSGLPPMNISDLPENISALLALKLDEGEHVEYQNKSSGAVKKTQGASSNVTFKMPKLSSCVEDWLQKVPVPGSTSKDVNMFSRCRPAPYPHLLINPAGQLPQGLQSASNPAAAVVASSGTDSQHQAGDCQQVRKNLKSWLSRGGTTPASCDTVFKHIPTDKKMWLRQAYWQKNNLKELKSKDFFQHISKETSTWLQTRAYLRRSGSNKGRLADVDFFSHMNKDVAYWLQHQKTSGEKTDDRSKTGAEWSCGAKKACCGKTCGVKGEDQWLSAASKANTSVYSLKDLCRANELCKNLSECVSQPDCLTMWVSENSTVKNQAVPMEIIQSMSSPLNEWLSLAVQKQTDCSSLVKGEKVNSDLFQHIRAAGDPMWLMNTSSSVDCSSATTPLPPARFKDDKEETNLWLQKTSSSSLSETTPSGEDLKSNSVSTDSDWLMLTADDKRRYQDLLESEGWSVCSDSHSISTDQHVKNLAVADEYFSKWLLQQ